MSTRTCHHVLANGALCQGAPLRDRDYCRFHLQQIGRRMKAARSRARHQAPLLRLPLLEDLDSVQVAIMQLADALAYREIDPQYGRLLTTVLRLAMQNLKSLQAWERSSRFQLAANPEGTPTAWDTFEQEHDLPADLDLSLDPEVAFPPQENSADAPFNPGFGLSGRELTPGGPNPPGVGMCGNDGFPFNSTEGLAGTHDDLFRTRVGNRLHDSATPVLNTPVIVTADQVEIVDVYEREGEAAMMKCIAEQQRNRKRRERRARRVHYEAVALNRNIQFAAEKLVADRQREAKAAAIKAQAASQDGGTELGNDAELNRKPPHSENASGERRASVAGA